MPPPAAGARPAAAGGSGLRFGRLWTGIIVTQVAISVAVLPILVSEGLGALRTQSAGVGYAASEPAGSPGGTSLPSRPNTDSSANPATSSCRAWASRVT